LTQGVIQVPHDQFEATFFEAVNQAEAIRPS